MGIEANFDMGEIERYMQERQNQLEALIIRNLNYLGMKCVVKAKSLDTYIDRTANLRNSIGYLVLKNGNVQGEFFEADYRGTEYSSATESGEVVGKAFAESLKSQYSQGFALVVVAGMNYASYVEDVHHLDVLKPAEDLANNEIGGIIDSIMRSLKLQ